MSKIRTQVMASVAVIHAARQFLSPVALKAYGLVVALVVLASMVSIGNVLTNLVGVGLSGAGHFFVVALTNTAGLVQLATAAGAIFAFLLVRDIVRTRGKAAPAFA